MLQLISLFRQRITIIESFAHRVEMIYVVLVMMVVGLMMVSMVITAQFEDLKVNILPLDSSHDSGIKLTSNGRSRETMLGTRRERTSARAFWPFRLQPNGNKWMKTVIRARCFGFGLRIGFTSRGRSQKILILISLMINTTANTPITTFFLKNFSENLNWNLG